MSPRATGVANHAPRPPISFTISQTAGTKAQFLSFDRIRRVYRVLGSVVGTAYHDGTKLMRRN